MKLFKRITHWLFDGQAFWRDRNARAFRGWLRGRMIRRTLLVYGLTEVIPALFEFVGHAELYQRIVSPIWGLMLYFAAVMWFLLMTLDLLYHWPERRADYGREEQIKGLSRKSAEAQLELDLKKSQTKDMENP